MKLRPDQLDLFAGAREDAFVTATARMLQRRYAPRLEAHGLAGDKTESFVRESADRARRYDVLNEADIRMFCECRLLLGLKFDAEPWAREILTTADVDGETKMNMLDERLLFTREEPT